ncbi:hypothetical protein NEPAR06_0040 [Nematocida parisii]|uniref:Uncharacterized protein n=1 Tax=Nematocida parisii (strain ERTm3) TaxID=935791 RepID=I3EE06_NEMP3|nr:uncharacterized protein NEPG_00055 [Nematocida parisii ERTm1]EIJ87453.1 hypothetical protein NEQG_02334 [Nematocida parisii ERTm3]KAI5142730.1 hypothetical protein NEPAR07_0256 [Nematocida parisii]EIJ94533.1 hypothetical protein NEPG_00055 [Nematocida parisii ERTm1]KAI5152919.1 hypothetical protein NEPAR06_0040 [Nematocida parisii]KAI5157442.1 hypothetical protein NEPAR05_1281 [Nematocida parisii]|eukprot:XP_013057889.1 hypothetical protein NEPG_00055 [Nematocida parisii ERTm1]
MKILMNKTELHQNYSISHKKQELYRTIRAIFRILLIFLLCGVFYVNCTKNIEEIYNTNLQDSSNKRAFVNPYGSLGMLAGFIDEFCGFMYNKRLFSAELDMNYINWESSKEGIFFNGNNIAKERVHRIFSNDMKMSYYSYLYHTVLINMFYIANDTVSIRLNNSNSDPELFRFLNAPSVKPHSHKIIAALLLLSEGVHVNIKTETIENQRFLIISDINISDQVISINISEVIKDSNDLQDINEVLQSEYKNKIEIIINFFLYVCNNPNIQELYDITETPTIGSFNEGKFMDSSRWLIQIYIYKYMNSQQEMIQFIKIVYSTLQKIIKTSTKKKLSSERINSAKTLRRKCFILTKRRTPKMCQELIHINKINSHINNTDKMKLIPFSEFEDVSKKRRILHFYSNRSNIVELAKPKDHSAAENTLLGIICCFLFDVRTQEYNLDHLPYIKSDLKRLFCMPDSSIINILNNRMYGNSSLSYNSKNKKIIPGKKISKEAYTAWTEIIQKLNNKDISYCDSTKRSIYPGLINLLYIISELTGTYESEKHHIKSLRDSLACICRGYDMHEDSNDSSEADSDYLQELHNFATKNITEYITKFFTSLSRNCLPKSKPSDFNPCAMKIQFLPSKAIWKGGKIDIFGKLFINYDYNGCTDGIFIYFNPFDSKVSLDNQYTGLLPDTLNIFKSINNQIKSRDIHNLTGHMVNHYISQRIKHFTLPREGLIIDLPCIVYTIDQFDSINIIHMQGKLSTYRLKSDLIICLNILLLKDTSNIKMPVISAIKNILSNYFVNNKDKSVSLPGPLNTNMYNISDYSSNTPHVFDLSDITRMIKYLILLKSPKYIIYWITLYLNNDRFFYSYFKQEFLFSISHYEIISLFDCLTEDGTNLHNVNRICDILPLHVESDEYINRFFNEAVYSFLNFYFISISLYRQYDNIIKEIFNTFSIFSSYKLLLF